jgi:hypothetical protein
VAQKLPAVKYAAEAAEETIMYPYTEVMDGRHIYRTFKYENSPMWRIGGLTPAGWRALREDITFTVLELPEPLPEMVRIIRPVSSGIIVDDQYPDDTMFAEIRSLSANPRQIIAPRRLILGSVATVQTARPIADLSNTGWVPSSGADLYPMVGETVRDDGTYIAATAVGAICELDLADLADPAVSTGHLPTLVLSAPGGGGITVRLRQGTTTIATWTYHPGATPTEYTPALSGAEADSITDYTALRLQFEAIA